MTLFALVDGNSFYCSCERAFDPTLRGKPVVVLSNNDGCIIARTQEAKDLGLKIGEPWHIASKRPGCESAWGPDADRHAIALILQNGQGLLAGAGSQTSDHTRRYNF